MKTNKTYKRPNSLTVFLKLLEDPKTRYKAFRRINEIPYGAQVFPIVSFYFTHPDPFTVAHAALAAGKTKQVEAIAPVIQLLETHAYPEVKLYAIYALAHLKARQAVPALINALSHQSDMIVSAAATALGEIGDPTALPALQRKLKEIEESQAAPKNANVAAAIKAAELVIITASGKSALRQQVPPAAHTQPPAQTGLHP